MTYYIQYIKWWLGQQPISFILLYVLAINIVTYLLYVYDKKAAIHHQWRIKETILHVVMFIGGTIGAIIGQKQLRHKTQKRSFRRRFYLLIALQLILLGLLIIV